MSLAILHSNMYSNLNIFLINHHSKLIDSMIEGFFDFKYIFFVEYIKVLVLRFNVVLSALYGGIKGADVLCFHKALQYCVCSYET